MNVLCGLVVYNRIQHINLWMNAWQNSDKYPNTKLLIIHNHDGYDPPKDQRFAIKQHNPDYYWPRFNEGQDIGAFRDLLRTDYIDSWDVLFWCTDDNIPMRKDFLSAFIKPFETNDNLGLVGNYWVKSSFYKNHKHFVPNHFRTTCFAIKREAAVELMFPKKLITKKDCYLFEWLSPEFNLTAQIHKLGFETLPVCGDRRVEWTETNDFIWDIDALRPDQIDKRRRKNLWKQYCAQFRINQ